MKYDDYISLIQRLEETARTHRKGYETKVLLLIILGYGYFVSLIILLLLPIPFLIAGFWFAPSQMLALAKIWWLIIPGAGLYFGFLGSAVRSITATVPDPPGTELLRNDAPELFDFVSSTCRSLKAQKPSKILLDDSFNAGVVTMPRLGIFGRKVFLLLGLPLLKALSSDQLRAVIAHEIGHISGKHGVFAKWAYQMREAWGRLIDSQDATDHKFSALYRKFVDWFFPYFTAYSFVLMREHEKDADLDAAKLVGAEPLGQALILIEMKSRKLNDEFWRDVHKENLTSDTPTSKMFTRMLATLAFVDPDRAAQTLKDAVAVPTDFNDSHPALADRLRLIGYWTDGDLPPMPEQAYVDSATTHLGSETVVRFSTQFDTDWDAQTAQTWKDRYEYFQESDRKIAELQAKQASGEATREELIDLAQLITNRDGMEASIPIIEESVKRFPDNSSSWFNLAYIKLARNDDTGLGDLEKAIEIDPSARYDAAQLAFDYLRSKGRIDEARRYATLLDEQADEIEKANKERRGISVHDEWEPHDLPQEFIDSIPKKIAGFDEVTAIYVAHKKVRYLPEHPFRVLFVEVRGMRKGDAAPTEILKLVANRLEDDRLHYYSLLDSMSGDIGSHLDAIEYARVFHSPDR